MRFNIKIWRKIYDRIQRLNPEDRDDAALIDELKAKSSKYLDDCGMTMPEPLWKYDPKDQTTWLYIPTKCNDPTKVDEWFIINPDFKYHHLVKKIDY